MFRGALARAGVFALLVACLVFLEALTLANEVRPRSVARVLATPAAETAAVAPARAREVARAEIVLGVESTPVATVEPAPLATPEPTPVPTPIPTPARTPAPALATLPQLPDPPTSGIVIASWYGPGFYGNRTACGQVYTPEIIGVAHRTLPCGTMVTIEFRGRAMTIPVIDRGPYIAGRTLDLSNATKIAMACTDLCTVSMRIGP
jgi:rare lipoprotein A (RlpA)-like double-psi beta-barrel protein